MAANTLIEVLEVGNGAQIYLDQYSVTQGKQDMILKDIRRLCDLPGIVYDDLRSFPLLLSCSGLAEFEIQPAS